MRWVLIRPHNRTPYYDPEIQEPLGLEFLAATLRTRQDQVLVLDSALQSLPDVKLARRAASFEPDAVGFSITTAQEIPSVRAIHEEFMRSFKGKPLWVAGGNFVSSEPERAIEMLPSGFVLVRFEGEQAVADISDLWEKRVPPEQIWSGSSVADLDSLPFPERPFAGNILSAGWAFNIQGSRGCCGSCRYCSSPGMSESPARRWRGRSPSSVAEEMELLNRKYGAFSFNFIDEDFLGPDHLCRERASQFATEIGRRGLKVSFGIQVRPSTLNPEIIDLLSAAGMTYVFMGIESDDPEDFRRWRRPWHDNPWPIISSIRSHGADINVGTLLFHSHSTFEGIRRFATRLSRHGLLEYRSALSRLDAMPGSYFHRIGIEREEIDRDATGPQQIRFINPGIEELWRDLVVALAPLGPPSMHAICSLPPLLARRFLDPRFQPVLDDLRRIIRIIDTKVESTFFLVLGSHEKGNADPALIRHLQTENLETAASAARDLAASGFVSSFEALREAIRIDSGL